MVGYRVPKGKKKTKKTPKMTVLICDFLQMKNHVKAAGCRTLDESFKFPFNLLLENTNFFFLLFQNLL